MTAMLLQPPTLALCAECGRPVQQLRRRMCHACYERDRRAGKISSLVDAGPARAAIGRLRAAGWNYREIARAAHIDRTLISHIINGRHLINAKTSQALTTINPAYRYQFHVNRCGWDVRPRPRLRLVPPIGPGVLVGNLLVCCGDCEHHPCACPAVDDADIPVLGGVLV